MTPQTDAPRLSPWLSIVVPLKNEAENIDFVTEAIVAACAPLAPYEIVYVDDGSDDDTAARVLALAARHPQVRLVQHAASAGQSAAVHSGVTLARGTAVCTLDGDGQNPPSEIPKLAARLERPDAPSPRASRSSPASASAARTPPRSAGPRSAANAIRQRAPQRRHPRHRLRAEALPPRRLPRPALLRPHAPLPAGARRPRRLADAAPGRRPRPAPRRPLELFQPRPRRSSASTISSASCGSSSAARRRARSR